MKRNVIRAAVLLLALMLCGHTVFVQAQGDTVSEADRLADGILNYHCGGDVQSFIDGALASGAGSSAEWYILSLSQSGDYDFSPYHTALCRYLEENTVTAASTRQKIALTLLSIGSEDEYIAQVMNDSIGEQGVMSWVYGLHLLNNGCISDAHTAESVVQKLLSLQLSDGGWAVMGDIGDVDVTAMTVQALAPYYHSDTAVGTALDNALVLLSSRQLDEGDFASYGVANPESTAQVMIALSALGIDCATDARFVKDGNTLFDALQKYRLSDGSFCHKEGGAVNANATAQVFCAVTAYSRLMNGEGGLYLLDSCHVQTDDDLCTATDQKLFVCAGILLAAGVICALLLLKKRHKKTVLTVLCAAALLIVCVLLVDIKTPEEYYRDTDDQNTVGTVTLTIRCDTVVGKSDANHIPKNGVILEETALSIGEDDTVYDVLIDAVKQNGILMESSGTDGMKYVSGIAHLHEFDFGDLSGWVYRVNGESASVGCDQYVLADGDTIEWLYTCEMGNDL